MVFASDAALEVLKRTTVISIDGTFSSAPAPFLQVFVLMATLPMGTQVKKNFLYEEGNEFNRLFTADLGGAFYAQICVNLTCIQD